MKQKEASNMSDPFETPGHGGDRVVLADVLGSLLLFTVHSVERGIETTFGESDAVKVDVVVLDGELKGTVYADTLIFPRVLQSQLSGKVGKMVIGRLEQGVAKKGQSAPWQLADPTDDDKEIGRKYLAHVAKVTDPF